MSTRNFRFRNDVVERGAVTKSQKGKRVYVERNVEECFQWKAHGHCSEGDSCSFCHDTMTSGNQWRWSETKKDDRLLPHPIRRQNRQTVKKATKRKGRTRICKKKKARRVSFGIFPSVKITSLKEDAYMETNAVSDMLRQRRSPAKGQRKVVQKDQLRY